MEEKYLSVLENKILDFLGEIGDEFCGEHDVYFHEELLRQMTLAAALVMDSSVSGQEFAASEDG